MSLEFDPEFVASKVEVLESDIDDIENSFVVKSHLVYDLNTQLSRRTSQLRSALIKIFKRIYIYSLIVSKRNQGK